LRERLLPSTCLDSRKDIACEVGVIPQTDGASCATPSITLKKSPSIIEVTHIMDRGSKAWMVEGRKVGWQPPTPVGVPSIEELLDRRVFKQTTLVPIQKRDFAHVRAYVRSHRLNPAKIPLLKREPRYEQEVLAVVAGGYQHLGIEKILRIRTAFPDMLVKLKGKRDPVHLELEVYASSFLAHGHVKQLDRKGQFSEKLDGVFGRRPVALVCWIRDAAVKKLRREGRIERVFELRSLLQTGATIKW